MDELEKIMKAIPLRAPSSDLDRRVMGGKPARAPAGHPRRSARRWLPAFTAAALAAIAGSLIVWLTATPSSSPDLPLSVSGRTVSTNPFDFTRPSSFFPSGKLEVSVRLPKGN